MYWNFSEIIDLFSKSNNREILLNGKWGFEKESLRVTEKGDLAMTPHPDVFGDKMKNPHVTTDFSESQIELITPAFNTIEKAFDFLYRLQTKVEQGIGTELLWPLSMPGILPDDEEIPIAKYNNSKQGREKEIYRAGLALRYGKKMQMISGIHYNFSYQREFWRFLHQKYGFNKEKQIFINEIYFALVRNFLRYRWLLFYLFGASPNADESYHHSILQKSKALEDSEDIKNLIICTQNAVSLRMSRFGYDNAAQINFPISFNSLEDYTRDLRNILSTKSNAYSKLGLYKDQQQIQLNDNLLQLENEYYSPVRFKQVMNKGETQLDALEKRGIQYVEIRSFDLNPFEKIGISLEQLYFIQVFMLFCLFEESDIITEQEASILNKNAQMTALFGRMKGLKLDCFNGHPKTLQTWGDEIFDKLRIIATLLDKNNHKNNYKKSVEAQHKKLLNTSHLPSMRILNTMQDKKETYLEFGIRKARKNGSKPNFNPENSLSETKQSLISKICCC